MKLADEARHAWKWLQTWLIAALAFSPLIYEEMASLQEYLPPKLFKLVMVGLGIATLVNNVRKKSAPTAAP